MVSPNDMLLPKASWVVPKLQQLHPSSLRDSGIQLVHIMIFGMCWSLRTSG